MNHRRDPTVQIPIADLRWAVQLLFSVTSVDHSHTNIVLDLPKLKQAYRKKALETHPDRSKSLGKNEQELVKKFTAITSAYEMLKPIVENGESFHYHGPSSDHESSQGLRKNVRNSHRRPGHSRFRHPPDTMNTQKAKRTSHLYQGPLPGIELKFNQYLYYSGTIPWSTYIASVVWEHRQCPRFGQIAKEWGFLSSHNVLTILRDKKFNEKFGEFACRHGYLSTFQQMAVLGKQRILRPSPDKFFIDHGFFSQHQLDRFHEIIISHNKKCRRL